MFKILGNELCSIWIFLVNGVLFGNMIDLAERDAMNYFILLWSGWILFLYSLYRLFLKMKHLWLKS